MFIRKKDAERILRGFDPSLRLGDFVGGGGMAAVYDLLGTDPQQVVKIMDTRIWDERSLKFRSRVHRYCMNEINAMGELKDDSHTMDIINWYEYIPVSERNISADKRSFQSVFFVQMPKLVSLTQYLEKHPNEVFSEQTAIRLAVDICKALQSCCEKRILHRDIKPDNIFLKGSLQNPQFILGDFGVSRRIDAADDGAVTQIGTNRFLAPEIIAAIPLEGRFNSDIYSLAVTIYFLLSGEFPSFLENKIKRIQGISENFSDIILKAIQINPKNRYQTATEMLRDLQKISVSCTIPGGGEKSNFFKMAKLAMLNREFDKALNIAKRGAQTDNNCRRLIAYIMYHENATNLKVVKEALSILDELIYLGDPIAKCLYGLILYENKDRHSCLRYLKESSEEGCVIAQYLYGRLLYEGNLGLKENHEQGINTMIGAIEAGYLPALRFLKHVLKRDPDVRYSPDMIKLLDIALEGYEERKREEIVRFL